MPDREVPLTEVRLNSLACRPCCRLALTPLSLPSLPDHRSQTLQAIDEQHKAGKFERFGIARLIQPFLPAYTADSPTNRPLLPIHNRLLTHPQSPQSNYSPAEVEEILRLTKEKSWIAPSVYQGMYSAVTRGNEPLLLPLLKKHNIAFYAYSPLGGGFFAGAIGDKDAKVEPGSRFDPNKKQGAMYRDRYLKDSYFTALDSLKKVSRRTPPPLSSTPLC